MNKTKKTKKSLLSMDIDDNDNRSLNDDDNNNLKLIELDEIENHLIKFIQSLPKGKYDEIKAKYLNSNNNNNSENSLSFSTNISMIRTTPNIELDKIINDNNHDDYQMMILSRLDRMETKFNDWTKKLDKIIDHHNNHLSNVNQSINNDNDNDNNNDDHLEQSMNFSKFFISLSEKQEQKDSNSKPYKCNTCEFVTAKRHLLIRHLLVHSTDKPFKCNQCQYATKRNDNLLLHIHRVHSPVRPYKCDRCKYRFYSERKLNYHIRLMHTTNDDDDDNNGQIKHQCNICYKTFASKYNLDGHKLIHTDKKPFGCQYCQQRFRRKDTLQNHIKNLHPQICN
ncbi:uncharacterized protein LOC113798311 isoform X2 [Dermatophagoides pteronyssinus]|uniref:uncharacterized protein LOC113798311 isoform X2 n=1 Tax=Dermatophagoides pteronyssinus TaxID=6956 RepID=UPI003F68027B